MLRFTGIHAQSGIVRMVPVDLGEKRVSVPVFDITGSRPGKTLLVTAGVDGDEYAGMEAAYALMETFASGNFAGRLIIIPIVNVPGFHAESSLNPLDQKYPKLVSLGTADGTPTQRLMHWLTSTYASHAAAWLDLHGGSLTEALNPFLWVYQTGVAQVDAFSDVLCSSSSDVLVVHESASMGSKAVRLAKLGCAYAIVESGARGGASRADVQRHVDVVHRALALLGMIGLHPEAVSHQHACVSIVTSLSAPFDGLWRLHHTGSEDVERGGLIGTYAKLDGSHACALRAPHAGMKLWWKETLSMRKGDTLCALAKPDTALRHTS